MTTPNLTGAIASIDEATASLEAAITSGEAPKPHLDLLWISLKDVRSVLLHHERSTP